MTSLIALLLASGLLYACTACAAGDTSRPAPAQPTRPQRMSAVLVGEDSKTDCVYSAESVTVLDTFENLVHRTFDCVLIYNDDSPNWAGWQDPWFLREQGVPSHNWQAWATARDTQRELIITQGLFPGSVYGTNWMAPCARGAFDIHARILALKLVAAGLGNAVIRLGHEANDSASPWFVGNTDQDYRLWDECWRHMVLTMKSVPGTHFLFDWTINAYWEPIPLSWWYPGNDVVNIIGIDAYDAGVPAGENRWETIYGQKDGIKQVLQFAAANNRPVSIGEWGLWEPGSDTLGGGDDPTYVNDIAGVVKHNRVDYQSYFYNLAPAMLLTDSPMSLAAYRKHFGGGGDTTGTPSP